MLAHLLGEEAEVVDQIFVAAAEVGAQLWILCGNTHRTGVEITFAHHDTTQDDECSSTETEFLGTEQGHENDVASALQLAVYL